MNIFAKIRFFFIIPIVCFGLFSCDPNEKLPLELVLKYEGCQIFGNSTGIDSLRLQIRYEKGDGNLGIDAKEEGTPPFVGKYQNNLFIYVFDRVSLTDTIYEPLHDGGPGETKPVTYHSRIPVLSDSRTASVKGMIYRTISGIDIEGIQKSSKYGIVRFEIYMYDRDLNRSNIIKTIPDIHVR